MRWSAVRLAPCSRSVAWPWATSLLASMRQRWLTTPPHCRAYAVMLPTRPPPPMMLTFMGSFIPELSRSEVEPWLCRRLRSLRRLRLEHVHPEDADARQHDGDDGDPGRDPDDLRSATQTVAEHVARIAMTTVASRRWRQRRPGRRSIETLNARLVPRAADHAAMAADGRQQHGLTPTAGCRASACRDRHRSAAWPRTSRGLHALSDAQRRSRLSCRSCDRPRRPAATPPNKA